jgi:hypothetical protein
LFVLDVTNHATRRTVMMIKRAACLAFTAACLTGIAMLPAAHAQMAYGPAGDPGGNSMGTPGPNPGGPGLTPYSGGAPTAGTYGATQPYPAYPQAPSAANTGNDEVVTNGPQGAPDWSARRNVIQSEHYDRLLESNRGFRQARMRKECGPITDPELRQQCLASFAEYEPAGASTTGVGSSTSSRHYRSNYGR